MSKRQTSDGSWLTLVEDEPENSVKGIYVLTVTWLDKHGNLRGFESDRALFIEAIQIIAKLTGEHGERIHYVCLNKLNAEASK